MQRPAMVALLRYFLVIVFAAILMILFYGVFSYLGFPWWLGLFSLIGLLGLALAAVFFYKVWLRGREQRFVNRMIEQDESRLKSLADEEKGKSKELQARWKEAIDALKGSQLRKQGNPLYVLPWYMIIGESGSGKTTAIQSASLSSPFIEVTRASGISGTKSCDWWFFEQAIIIDTAGRYAIPIEEGRDKEEWQRFLGLLSRYRKREPINGLIVAVPSDKLSASGAAACQEDGKKIRRRIDELMRVLGAKFPVYVLVTKCDLIQGMTQFADLLPPKSLQQPLGMLNPDLSTDVAPFLDRAMRTIGDRLKDLRLLLLQNSRTKDVDPGLLLFPEEFERLRPGLEPFVTGTFGENPYQDTPLLRGIFFSSGKQEGMPFSHFLNALGLIGKKELLPGTSKGLFLHDFFARILPNDRGLFAPTRRAIAWSRFTRNIGLTAWVSVIVAVCGLLSYSFAKNVTTLQVVSTGLNRPPAQKTEAAPGLAVADHLCQTILRVEKQNRSWWAPRLWLNESKQVELALKDRYCTRFKETFLNALDQRLAQRVQGLSSSSPDRVIFSSAMVLVRRIGLLKARLAGAGLERLQAMAPASSPGPGGAEGEDAEFAKTARVLYYYYLLWRKDLDNLSREVGLLQQHLLQVLSLKGSSLSWLGGWVNEDPALTPLTLRDFWTGSRPIPDEVRVAPAFTSQGRSRIDLLLKEIEAALADPVDMKRPRAEFQAWYNKAFFEAWHHFAGRFHEGVKGLARREEWLQAVSKMGAEQGPYGSLLERMADEFKSFATADALPQWARLVLELKLLRLGAPKEGPEKSTMLSEVAKSAKKIFGESKDRLGKVEQRTGTNLVMASAALNEYLKSLEAMKSGCMSRRMAFEMAGSVYGGDGSTRSSPVIAAQEAAERLKGSIGHGTREEETVWRILGGPFQNMWFCMRNEAACQLQEIWEKDVLFEIQETTDYRELSERALGGEGSVHQFLRGPAAAFVSRNPKVGYFAKTALGEKIPFKEPLFSFLTHGVREQAARAVKEQYTVLVKALPTEANPEALKKPHATFLEVQGSGEDQRLENFNFPAQRSFVWVPAKRGDVILKIQVHDLTLTKRYEGEMAFPRFVTDFEKGFQIFYPRDFEEKEEGLKRLGIQFIKVKYSLQNHLPVMALARQARTTKVPKEIVTCWGQ